MATDRQLGTKLPENVDPAKATGVKFEPGTYKAIIKQNVDELRMGRLCVWLPNFGGDEDNPVNWRWVGYASPYYGSTQQTDVNGQNTFAQSETTYGMWFVPPDVGNSVLVTFPNGDSGMGYWFACVGTRKLSHNMVPALGRYSGRIDKENVVSNLVKASLNRKEATYHPLAEFNENNEANMNGSFLANKFPIHEAQSEVYINQGLDVDPVRGAISSSSMRESPSAVFGISTPGRATTEGSVTPATRQGGHVFVMDDGTVEGTDRLIRLRTATGHQILMNDTEQVLYIANANGYSWLEFASDGSIHMFADGGFNVRTRGKLNLHSDDTVNIQGKTVNIKSESGLNLNSSTMSLKATSSITMFGPQIGIGSTGAITMTGDGQVGIKSGAELKLVGSFIRLNDGAVTSVADPGDIVVNGLPDAGVDGDGLWGSTAGALSSIVNVAPTHEPYLRGAKTIRAKEVAPTVSNNICGDNPTSPAGQFSAAGGAGPFGDFVAKLESGLAGYDAFNRGSSPPRGTGTVGGEKMSLTTMTISSILSQRASNQPDPTKRLFAVGRYQCIPDTLTAAVSKLGIPQTSVFSSEVQDNIFINVLCNVGALKTYLNGPDQNDEGTLTNACSAAAGVWASIEDPKLSPVRGRYDGQGTNSAHGKVADCKAALKAQWQFLKSNSGAVKSGTGSTITDGSGNPVQSAASTTDAGILAARGQPVTKQAPAEYMKRDDAPNPTSGIDSAAGSPGNANYIPGLTQPQVKALMVEIAYAETSNDIGYNSNGMAGRYAVNGIVLAAYGYIKPDYVSKYGLDVLGKGGAWTGKDGINSVSDFISSVAAQDAIMFEFITDAYSKLVNRSPKGIDLGDNICTVAGMISVAYFFRDETQFIGSDVNAMAGAATDWRKNNTGKNNRGSTPLLAYNQGRYAIDILSISQATGADTPPSTTGIDPNDIFIWGPNASQDDFEKLTVTFKDAMLTAGKAYKDKTGKKIKITSAYRSQEDQDRLYNKWLAAGGGPTTPTAGGITTPAKTVGSHAGVAIDAGQQAKEINDTIDLAQYGLRWGGTFRTPDIVHIQLANYVAGQTIA